MIQEDLTITPLPIEQEGVRVIKLDGPLTLKSVFEFQDALHAEKSQTVILDFSTVPYVDSAGIGAIVRGHVSACNQNRRLLLVGLADRVVTILRVSKVEGVLVRFPSLKEAMASIQSRAS